MTPITTIWFDVKEILPGEDHTYGMPVRCINRDECVDFYGMAYYRHKSGTWDFFHEEWDKVGNEGMQVTHWTHPIELSQEDEHRWKDEKPTS